MRTQEWIQKKKKKKKKKKTVSDTLVYGQTRARCVEKNNSKQKKKQNKKKTATTTLKASSTRDTLETRHISVVRWRIRNVLVLALYALQIVQVERLSCKCAISNDRSRFILSPAPQRNATVLFSTRSPRLQTVTGVRLSRYSCLVIPEGRPTIRQNTARLV